MILVILLNLVIKCISSFEFTYEVSEMNSGQFSRILITSHSAVIKPWFGYVKLMEEISEIKDIYSKISPRLFS
jgi:hypothetical protein